MDANTCQAILNAHDICQRWKTKLLIPHGDDIVDVSYEETCNHNKIPAPTVGQLPKHCYYHFDTLCNPYASYTQQWPHGRSPPTATFLAERRSQIQGTPSE